MASYTLPATSKNIWAFDPTSVGGCILWLDGADSNTTFSDAAGTIPSTNGGNVVRWRDKSISGNNALSILSYSSTVPTASVNWPISTATTISYVTNIPSATWLQGLIAGNTLTVTGYAPSAFNVTNATISSIATSYSVSVDGNGTTATYTITSAAPNNTTLGLISGSTVTVSGFGTAAFNGTFTMATQTSTTFTVGNTTNSGGTLIGGTVISTSNFGANAVITVTSSAANGLTVTSATSPTVVWRNTKYPTLSTSSVAFTGGQYFGLTANVFPSAQSNATYFVVASTNSSSRQTIFTHGANAGGQGRFLQFNQIVNNAGFYVTNAFPLPNSGAMNLSTPNIITGVIDNYIQSGWINGNSFATGNNGDIQKILGTSRFNTNNTNASIGLDYGYATVLVGNVYEILVYNSTLSNADRQAIEGYLANKWKLTSSLPPSHGYNTISIPPYFVPTSLPNCGLWYDASDSSTVFASGTPSFSWVNKTALTTSSRNSTGFPTYVPGIVNSRNTILCNDNTQGIQLNTGNSTNFGLGNGGQLTFMAVVFSTATSGNIADINAFARFSSYWTTTGIAFSIGGTSSSTITRSGLVGAPFLLGITSTAASGTGTLYINGTSIGTITSGTGTYALQPAVARDAGGPTYFCEVIGFNSFLTATQREQAEGFLAWKWGLQASLPSTHPYYSIAVASQSIPLNIPNCRLWLDGADISTMFTDIAATVPVTDNNQTVLYWKDKSGNGIDLQAPTADPGYTGPVTSFKAKNNRNTLTFSGTSYLSMLSAKVASLPIGTATGTFFSVSQTTLPPPTGIVMNPQMILSYGTEGPTQGSMRVHYYNGGLNGSVYRNTLVSDTYIAGRIGDSAQTTNSYVMFSNIMTSAVSGNNGWNNGTAFDGGQYVPTADLSSTSNFNTLTTTPFGSVGSGISSGSFRTFYLFGNVAEILVYGGVLSSANRQTIEGYLAWKWGLQASLPSTHPYALANYFVSNTRPMSRYFSPTDIEGCQIWMDPADQRTVTLTGSNVTAIADKSGQNNNFTNGSSTVTYASTLNNLRVLTFPSGGGSNFLNSPTLTRDGLNKTFFIVCRYAATGTSGIRSLNFIPTTGSSEFFGHTGSTTPYVENNYQGPGGGTVYTFYVGAPYASADAFFGGNTFVLTCVRQNGVFTITTNGSTVNSGTNADGTGIGRLIDDLATGVYQISPGNTQTFQYGDVIIYNTGLTPSERQAVEGYLLWKWGLRTGGATSAPNYSMPTTHPFYKYPPPSSTPFQPELELYKKQFDPSDLLPTVWLDSADATTYASTNNRLTSWTSKGSQALTFAPPNIPYMVEILSGTTVPVGSTGTTFSMSRSTAGVGTITGVTVTVGGVGIANCTLVGGSPTLITGSSVTITGGASVTATRYSITLQNATTTTGGTGTTFTLNLAPTGTGSISGVQAYIAGVPIPNCTFTGGSTTFTTGASTTIASGSDVVVQPGPLINRATRGSGLDKTYTDFTAGGTFRLTAASNTGHNATAITVSALSVALDDRSIVISTSPRVTLTINQRIIFNGSGTVIPGTTNITAGTIYFIRSVSTLITSNTNFPTHYITLSLSSGGGVITGLTVGALTGVTAAAGAYLFTLTTSIPHRIPNGAPITVVLDAHTAPSSNPILGSFFGNVQSVPSTTTLTFWLTSTSTTIPSGASSNLAGCIQYGNNTLISGSLAGDGTTLTLTTASPHNLQTGFIVQPYFFGPSLPSHWAPYTSATVRSGTSTFTGIISGTVLSVSTGTPPGIGAVLSGAGVTAGTYVRGILTYGTSYDLSVASAVPSPITITSTYTGPITFTGSISGTTLTYTAGTVPLVGMILSGTNVTSGTYILSGTSPTFTVSTSSTAASTTITASNYSVELTFPATNWPILPNSLNNGGNSNIVSSTGNNITVSNNTFIGPVGSIIIFTSAVGAVPAGAYYIATLVGSVITISSSRTLTPILTPGPSSTTVVTWTYAFNSLFRFCSFGTTTLTALNNSTGSIVWIDNATRTISLSGFTIAQPAAGVMTMSQIQNPGIQYTGSGSFAHYYSYGVNRVTVVDTTSFTISLNNLFNAPTALVSNASQTYGGVTYSGPMANYGFTDFRFGGNGVGNFSFGNAIANTITQAMISYPAMGYLLESSGSNLTNSFSTQTTTVLMAVQSSTLPIRAPGQASIGSTLLSTSTVAGNIGGTNATSGGQDFAFRPCGTAQGVAAIIQHNNQQISFRPPAMLDTTSGYRIFSLAFNGTGFSMGDVAALTRNGAAFGWRYDGISGTFAFDAQGFISAATTAGTILSPTVMRLGGDTSTYGFGVNPMMFSDLGIAELLVFNRPLTLEQRQLAEGYLSQKYCCQHTLANGSSTVSNGTFVHPYRLSPTSISASLDLTQSYSQGLAFWFDAANITTLNGGNTPSNGANVTSWAPAGGSLSITLTGGGGGVFPTYQRSAQNTLPAIRFPTFSTNAANLYYNASVNLVSVGSNSSYNPEYTIFVAFKTARTPSSFANFIIDFGAINLAISDGAIYSNIMSTFTATYTPTINVPCFITLRQSGNRITVRLNGLQVSSATTTPLSGTILTSYSRFVIGSRSVVETTSTNAFVGDLYETAMFRYGLTDQTIYHIEAYLAWKWGLQTALPTTHPYYKVRP